LIFYPDWVLPTADPMPATRATFGRRRLPQSPGPLHDAALPISGRRLPLELVERNLAGQIRRCLIEAVATSLLDRRLRTARKWELIIIARRLLPVRRNLRRWRRRLLPILSGIVIRNHLLRLLKRHLLDGRVRVSITIELLPHFLGDGGCRKFLDC